MNTEVSEPDLSRSISENPRVAAYIDALMPLFLVCLWIPIVSIFDFNYVRLVSSLEGSDKIIRVIHFLGCFFTMVLSIVALFWTYVRHGDDAMRRLNAIRKRSRLLAQIITVIVVIFLVASAAIMIAYGNYSVPSLIMLLMDLALFISMQKLLARQKWIADQ